MQRRIVPDVVDGRQSLTTFARLTSVKEAAVAMSERRIGAVMVVEDDRLVGILTERDIVRCVANGMDIAATPIGLVMTRDPDTLKPGDPAMLALERMQEGNYRHLPVLDDAGALVGMVSVRDLFAAVRQEIEDDLRSCEAFVSGESYGLAHQ